MLLPRISLNQYVDGAVGRALDLESNLNSHPGSVPNRMQSGQEQLIPRPQFPDLENERITSKILSEENLYPAPYLPHARQCY